MIGVDGSNDHHHHNKNNNNERDNNDKPVRRCRRKTEILCNIRKRIPIQKLNSLMPIGKRKKTWQLELYPTKLTGNTVNQEKATLVC